MPGAKTAYDDTKLPIRLLLGYSVISIPLAAILLPVFMYVPTFYAQEMGISLSLIGVLVFLARLWDGVTDPTIGILSDRLHTRYGRRKPWIAVGTLITAVSSYFLFAPPTGSGAVHLTVTLFALYLGWTMVAIPHGAWGAELTRHYDQRSRLVGTNMAADTLGFFIIGLIPILLGLQGEDFSGALLATIALPMALLLPLAALVPLAFVPNGYSDAPAPGTAAAHSRAGLKDLAGNAPFLRLCGGMICSRIGEGIRTTLAVLFVTYYWQRTDVLGYAVFLVTLGTLLSIPLWLWASRRYEKATAWRIPLILSIGLAPVVLVIDPAFTPGILVLFFVSGLLTGGTTVLPSAMLGDVVDFDSLKSKTLRAGTYLSVWSFGIKLVYAVPILLIFPLLDLAGFDAALGAENSETALTVLGLAYALAPIPFSLLALGAIWAYPLDRRRHGVVRRRLEGLGIGTKG